MAYQSILVHVDRSARCRDRVEVAVSIAVRNNAHLIGLAPTGVVYLPYGEALAATGPYYDFNNIPQTIGELRDRALQAADDFEAQVSNRGLRSYEKRVAEDAASYALVVHGRYADLIVLGQTDLNDATSRVPPDFPEEVLLNAGRPVLLIPYAGRFPTIGSNVLVAWNASREAARTVTDALPFLVSAERVRVATFNAKQSTDGHGPDPGTDIALYLARHGVKVEATREQTSLDIGSALLSRAADFGSDLIVLGGYGHSRFRETLLGGVTKTLLAHMTAPVLMSH